MFDGGALGDFTAQFHADRVRVVSVNFGLVPGAGNGNIGEAAVQKLFVGLACVDVYQDTVCRHAQAAVADDRVAVIEVRVPSH